MAEKMMLTSDQALQSTDKYEMKILRGLVKAHIKVQIRTLMKDLAQRHQDSRYRLSLN